MKTAKLTIALFGVTALVASGLAFAQGMGQGRGGGMGRGMGRMAVVTKLCAKEISTHCTKEQQGPGLRTCLEAKEKELSENCQTALEATGPDSGRGSGPVARLCMVEIDKFCAEVEHVNGQVRTCLEKKRSELGNACTVALDNTGWGWKRMQGK
ncbi:MAG: cysteine rich repeat-containing protein [Alphaproteobacteria bacterium]